MLAVLLLGSVAVVVPLVPGLWERIVYEPGVVIDVPGMLTTEAEPLHYWRVRVASHRLNDSHGYWIEDVDRRWLRVSDPGSIRELQRFLELNGATNRINLPRGHPIPEIPEQFVGSQGSWGNFLAAMGGKV